MGKGREENGEKRKGKKKEKEKRKRKRKEEKKGKDLRTRAVLCVSHILLWQQLNWLNRLLSPTVHNCSGLFP